MKKTLIAIAALVATGAFAQSSVTISGTMDVGYLKATTQATNVDTTKTSFAANNTATSAVFISGVEDLGGGMKASFFVESNPAIDGAGAGAFGSGQRFLGLSGGFGSVKMGAANSETLVNIGRSNPFGTALGGGYSGSFSRLGNGAGVRVIRNPNTLRYDSPVFSGFAASYELGFENKNSAGGSAASAALSNIGLTYSAGPLNVGFTTGSIKNGASTPIAIGNPGNIVTTNAGTATVATPANGEYSAQTLSANYTFGATTVYAGHTSAEAKTAGVATDKTTSMNLAVKHQMGAIALMGNYLKRSDKTPGVANAANGNVLGLGLDYALSKRTTGYARHESLDTNKFDGANGKSTALSFGVRHTF